MMFYINPLSAHGQFKTKEELSAPFLEFISMLEYLRPAYSHRRCTISYDESIHLRNLIPDEDFTHSLNLMRRDPALRDAVAKWFQLSKNQFICDNNIINEVNYSGDGDISVNGAIGASMLTNNKLINFGGSTLTQSKLSVIKLNDDQTHKIDSTHDLCNLFNLTPRYEPSDKHRKEPYYANGVIVSAMPLTTAQGQETLLQSIPHNNDTWSYRKACNRYFRFKRTHIDRLIYESPLVS